MSIGVHVIGPGYGESVIVEFPDGTAGVVDAHRQPGSRRFPAVEFLHSERRRLRVRPLRFVVVTHPHADHCLGINELIDEFRPEKLMVFPAIIDQEFREYLQLLKKLRTPDAVEAALRLPAGTTAGEIFQLFGRVAKQARRTIKRGKGPQPDLIQPPGGFSIAISPTPVHVRYLTPGPLLRIHYADQLKQSLRGAPRPGSAPGPSWSPASIRPNLASGALVVEYGLTRLLLTADAEVPLWNEWSRNPSLQIGGIACMKVGHHGSANGYHAGLYKHVSGSVPAAILTPFDRQQHALPSRGGMKSIRPHLGEIFCTNRFSAARSSGYPWKPVPRSSHPTIPTSWVALCLKAPQYRGLLSPLVNGPRSPASLPVPAAWRRDCLKDPELLNVLHPDLPEQRVILAKLPASNEFRVGLYFDSTGQEIPSRRHIGRGAGRL
jgi:beta-lactamase superfamily II metal-dependent hydrolase